MTKKRALSYLLNLAGVAVLFAALTAMFAFNGFGDSTTYVEGVCTTADCDELDASLLMARRPWPS